MPVAFRKGVNSCILVLQRCCDGVAEGDSNPSSLATPNVLLIRQLRKSNNILNTCGISLDIITKWIEKILLKNSLDEGYMVRKHYQSPYDTTSAYSALDH